MDGNGGGLDRAAGGHGGLDIAVIAAGGDGGLDMAVQPAVAVGPEATFRVAFLNQMPYPAVVTLAVRDKEDGLRVRTRPTDSVVVPARGTSTITVQVVPPPQAEVKASSLSGALDGEPHAYELEFRGRQPGLENMGACDVVRRARFTYVPRRAAWSRTLAGRAARLLIAALLLLVVVAGGYTVVSRAMRPAAPQTTRQGVAAIPHTIVVGKDPLGVEMDRTTGRAFVVNQGSNTVSMLDTRTGAVEHRPGLGRQHGR